MKTVLTPDQTTFLRVLQQICSINSFRVRYNLIDELHYEIYGAWVHARVKVRDAVYKENQNPSGIANYGTGRILKQRLSEESSRIIGAWLIGHKFSDLNGGIPIWLFESIEDVFLRGEEKERQIRSLPEAPVVVYQGTQDLSGTSPIRLARPQQPTMPPPPPCPWVFYRPPRNAGENKREYLRRERKLFKAWQDQRELATPQVHRDVGSGQRRKSGKYEEIHFEFLALQYCGLGRQEIHRRYRGLKLTPTAITNGAKSAAISVGLKRPRAASTKGEK